MNIIFITPELPYPANSGGRIYTWERLKQLKHNNIYLFALKNRDEKVELDELNKICCKVNIYERKGRYFNSLLNLLKPYPVVSRFNSNMYRDINNLINEKKIDLIIIDIPEVILNCPFDNNIPKVLTQHNIEYKVFKNISQNSQNILKKIIYNIESIKMKKFEDKLYKSGIINAYTFISEDEMNEFQKIYTNTKSVCIPQGYDIKVKDVNKKDNKKIVFTGKMDYEPNVQAVKWFVKDIFPIIQAEVPQSKFYIVGKAPTEEVTKLSNKNIIVTGEVKDVQSYLQDANLCVIPLLSGGGVKIKLFEAIGNGNIVVSTSKGIEGTKFKNMEHLIVEDNNVKFAEKCIDILNNKLEYEHLVREGMKLIINKYSWDAIGEKYNQFINEIVNIK